MTATPANFTQFDAFMKELYSDWEVPFSAVAKDPLLLLIRHDKKAKGNHQVVPVEYGNGGGRSATFSIAQSTTQGSGDAKFIVTWVNDYADAQIQGDIADFSEGEGAVVDAVTREMESKRRKLMNSLCAALYRDKTGKVGQSSTSDSTSGNRITLTNKYDSAYFKVGDWIEAFPNGATVARTNNVQLVAVDRINGFLSTSLALSTITGFTAGDNIGHQGDFGLKLSGLQGWLPGTNTSAVTGSTFFNVLRNLDTVEEAGWTHDFTGQSISIEDCIVQAAMDVKGTDGEPDYCFMNNQDWRKLELSLGTLVRYHGETEVKFGFKAISISAPGMDIKCVASVFCPQSEAFLLTLDRWVLKTKGEAPKVLDRDGRMVRYIYNDDVVEVRMGYRGQLICESPKMNSHLYLPVQIGK